MPSKRAAPRCSQCAAPGCSGAHPQDYSTHIQAIEAALEEGYSQSEIARQLDYSRAFVNAVARGSEKSPLCEFCNASFFPRNTGPARFCCPEHWQAWLRGERAEPAQPSPSS